MLEVAEVGNKIDKKTYKDAVPDLRLHLVNAEYDLREHDFPVIVWIAGDDRVAANEMVNRINEWMDARYIHTHIFGEPTATEAERPRLWRLWQSLPPKGQTAVIAGGLMSAARQLADGDISETEFSTWLSHVTATQEELVADGALILKFFLHTPAKVQAKRRKKTKKDKRKGWMADRKDWEPLDNLGPVLPVAERILRETTTPGAPWMIIESSDARYRDLTVAKTILDAMTSRMAQTSKGTPPAADSVFGDLDSGANALSGVNLDQSLSRDSYRRQLAKEQGKLHELSLEARDRGISTVLGFEGWDAGGKGGAIRRITWALESGDYRIIPVAAPTAEENNYHYLWRFWRDLPPAGKFAIFDRTWYGRVLVERVEGFAQPEEWQRAYQEINDFEAQIAERGAYVAKFWLHISPEEQLARFEAREETPYKQHKITEEDYRNRERWDDYVRAVDQMLVRTTTDDARWHVIPANDKWFARVAVLKAVNEGLSDTIKKSKNTGQRSKKKKKK